MHALYSEREIFLRELVANAADAVDRRRFEALTNEALSLPIATLQALRIDDAALSAQPVPWPLPCPSSTTVTSAADAGGAVTVALARTASAARGIRF